MALARGPKEVDRCLMAELAGGLLPGLDPELQQKPVVDLLVGWGGRGGVVWRAVHVECLSRWAFSQPAEEVDSAQAALPDATALTGPHHTML